MSNSTLTILLYHGVTRSQAIGLENISGKHIQAEEYFNQMQWLKNNAYVISMEEVYEIITKKKKFPKKAVAVTFDDGFENNFTEAFPVIVDLEIPTTFYISSAMIGTQNMFWVDQLEDCINNSKLDAIEIYLDDKRQFNVKLIEDKIKALSVIKSFCKSSSNLTKENVIKQVVSQTKHNPNYKNSDNYRVMNWSQLYEMSLNKNIIIGGHSLSHEILSKLSIEDMRINIELSIKKLEMNLDRKIEHYSYPEGQEDHYNEEVIKALKDSGIKCCPSAIHGINHNGEDLFNLKRIMVGFGDITFPSDSILSIN